MLFETEMKVIIVYIYQLKSIYIEHAVFDTPSALFITTTTMAFIWYNGDFYNATTETNDIRLHCGESECYSEIDTMITGQYLVSYRAIYGE